MNAEHLLQHFDRLSEAPDAIQRLRRFILDLAVRGKLVEQDPNDEPAPELLKRIETEKARLVKEGKLKKTSAGSADNSSDTSFDLPRSWVRVCLGDVAQYGLSDKVNSNKDIADDTWVLDLEDIEKNTSRLIERIPSSARPFRSTKTIFQRGDVLFGKLRPYLNKVLVANEGGVCTTEIVPIRGYCNIVPEYIKLVFMSPVTMRRVDRLMYGMKMPRLGTNDAISLEFPLAPLAEQHHIVAKVAELMALCDQLEATKAEREQSRDRLMAANLHHLNQPTDDEEAFREHVRFTFNHLPRITTRPAHIKQLRQTILNLAVCGKLVPQDPNDEPAAELLKWIQAEKAKMVKLGQIKVEKTSPPIEENNALTPRGWSLCRWNSIAMKIGDIDHKMPETVSNGVPYVSPRDFYPNNVINFDGAKRISQDDYLRLAAKIKPDSGDLIYPRYGTIGENRLVMEQLEFLASYSCAVIKTMKGFIDPKYQYIFSISGYCKDQAKAAENKTTQANVGIASIQQYIVPLPPLAEQHRIVAKVDELMELCNQLETQIITTETDSRRLLEAVLHEALAPALGKVA